MRWPMQQCLRRWAANVAHGAAVVTAVVTAVGTVGTAVGTEVGTASTTNSDGRGACSSVEARPDAEKIRPRSGDWLELEGETAIVGSEAGSAAIVGLEGASASASASWST